MAPEGVQGEHPFLSVVLAGSGFHLLKNFMGAGLQTTPSIQPLSILDKEGEDGRLP